MSQFTEHVKELAKQEVAAKKLELRAAAQDIVDIVRPGEAVSEVVINTNTGTSVKEILETAERSASESLIPEATKIKYFLYYTDREFVKRFYDYYDAFDTRLEALDARKQAECHGFYKYYIFATEVPAE
ncbi:Uncharacterised protein [uncultured archaeon]|nr:Uncharacterised protein [uncultured archaeon]